MKKIFYLLALIFCCQIQAFAQSSIEKFDFENFTHQSSCLNDKLGDFKLKNGIFYRTTIMMDDNIETSVKISGKHFFDVNGDQKIDAIIFLTCNFTGRPSVKEGLVYTLKTGKPILLSRIKGDFANFGNLNKVELKDKILSFTFNYRNDFFKNNDTKQYFQFLYKWHRGKLIFHDTQRTSF